MLKLPKIPYTMDKDKQQVVSMGNINYSKMTKDGDVADSSGISGRHFPYITTAKECSERDLGENIKSATFFRDKWVTVDEDGILRYGGNIVGPLEKGEKQFAAINTKLVIMPDKKYLDVGGDTPTLRDLGASIKSDIAKFTSKSIIVQNWIRFAGGEIGFNEANGEVEFVASLAAATKDVAYIMVHRPVSANRIELKFIEIVACDYCTISSDDNDNDKITIRLLPGRSLVKEDKIFIEELYADKPHSGWYTNLSDCVGDGDSESEICLSGQYGGTTNKERELYIYKLVNPPFKNLFSDDDKINLKISWDNGISSEEMFLNAKEKEDDEKCWIVSTKYDWKKLWCGDWAHQNPNVLGFGADVSVSTAGYTGSFEEILSEKDNIKLSFEKDGKKITVKGEVVSANSNRITISPISPIADLPWGTIDSVITLASSPREYGCVDLNDFMAGDVVRVKDLEDASCFLDFRICSISDDGYEIFAQSETFTGLAFSSSIEIERRIPDMDYICEYDNRLYGCSNADHTIYVSALGDPTNIYAYEGVSTDSYAVAVASEGKFTGCCAYDGGVMFWKEQKLHKLLGSYPAEYALYTYNIDGVQEGSHKSLQNIGEVLFYKGERGVFAFDGSPRLISENFGEKKFKDAVAGNDGECYYISMKDKDNNRHFFSYNTRTGLWVREGDLAVSECIRNSNGMYMLQDGKIYLYGAEETSKGSEWVVQFAPIYETIEGKKSYSRIKMRIELPKNSHMVVSVRCDGGRWAECGKIVGRVAGVVPVMVPINRCDKFELKISGKGPCTIHSILREYYVGGDR